MTDDAESTWTTEEVKLLKALLAENAPLPPHIPGSMGRREHVTYCFSQMIRFAHLAHERKEAFRSAQFGLSLGRVQARRASRPGPHAQKIVSQSVLDRKLARPVLLQPRSPPPLCCR